MDFDGFKELINGIGDGEKNTAIEVRNLLNNLIQNIFLPGDIKWVFCTAEDIANDYTADGLGKGKREGWRICNGLHGTPTLAGRVAVGYGDGYTVIGDTGGSKDAVVVSHTHFMFTNETVDAGSVISASNQPVKEGYNGGSDGNQNYRIRGTNTAATVGRTSTAGESGAGKNMQPYTILLPLMKLP